MKAATIKKILILVTILAVPGFLYYMLQEKGKNRYKPLLFFGPKEVAATFHSFHGKKIPDTNYHHVNDFKLINQNADTVNWKNYKGKIVIINLFYTKENVANISFANKAMKNFVETYDHNRAIGFISLSIDPTDDTPEVLTKYAQALSAKAGKWDLLTGDSTQIFTLINKGLFIDAYQEYVAGKKKIVYNNMFILLDTQRRIRGYYEATNQEAVSKLDDEIKVLIAEVLRNTNDGR